MTDSRMRGNAVRSIGQRAQQTPARVNENVKGVRQQSLPFRRMMLEMVEGEPLVLISSNNFAGGLKSC
jgi:hypothetical protein